jgi:hypothetical protein
MHIKIPILFFTEIEFLWKYSYGNIRSQTAEEILSKKSNTGVSTIPDFKLYYRAIVQKQHGTGTKIDMKRNTTE